MRVKRTFFCFVFFIMLSLRSFCDVTINIVVANPSESEKQYVPVEYMLPVETQKEDVLESGELKVEYNVLEGRYYVSGEVLLEAKESKRIRIVVKDVWNINQEEIKSLNTVLEEKVKILYDPENTELNEMVDLLSSKIKSELETIASQQESWKSDVDKRMQMYSVHKKQLQSLKDQIFSLETFVRFGGKQENKENITLVIEAENVLDETNQTTVTYYLPKEVIPDYIEDKGEFELKYDHQSRQFYLEKEDSFSPKEKKKFNVVIKNVWKISENLLGAYIDEAKEKVEGLGDSEMALIAQALSDEIEQEAELIKASQAKQETVKGHIATHRLNQERLLKIEDNLKKIRSLIDKPEKSLTQKDVDEVFKKMEQVSKLQLKKMAEKIFQKIKQIGVWRIILVMVSFLAALTTFFYTVWYIRLKKDEKIQYEKLKIKTAKEKEAEEAANE